MPDQIIPLGEAWASSSVNCVAFRHDAIVPVTDGCVVSFYDADGNVVLQHLDRALVPQRRLTIACPIVPHDAHNCISLGVDSSGAVHAVFGAHSSIAYHVRVSPLLDGAAPEAVPLDGRPQMRFTYPTLLHDPGSGELRLLYREGGPWAGELRVKRWNDEAAAFIEDELPLLSGRLGQPTAGPYINRPVRLPDGRIALFCVWRLARDATTAGDVANTGLDLIVAAPDLKPGEPGWRGPDASGYAGPCTADLGGSGWRQPDQPGCRGLWGGWQSDGANLLERCRRCSTIPPSVAGGRRLAGCGGQRIRHPLQPAGPRHATPTDRRCWCVGMALRYAYSAVPNTATA
ncbi:BNR-4 repeat-containing protein [Paeniroseomonas aquatica]|uniref:BNR-4 repeat-containing protein n=1 Tax=Paeniroseomonas aquatica TaxID=373043 RepID=UPI0036115BE1